MYLNIKTIVKRNVVEHLTLQASYLITDIFEFSITSEI